MMPFKTILKGGDGEYEISRVIGAFGALTYIVAANGFEAHRVLILGKEFDITAYCLAFPTGLGVAVGAIAGAIRLRGRLQAKDVGDGEGNSL